MKADNAGVLFISDLHLSQDEPATCDRFRRFLRDTAATSRELYILGDLFEAWPGDDDLGTPFSAGIADCLRRLVEGGVPVSIMHGNRDFLLGTSFCESTGARLIADPCVIDLHGVPTMLTHGDRLCADDIAYQQFRAQVRDPAWQSRFLARPLPERKAIAESLRQQSIAAKDGKEMAIMDVSDDEVSDAFRVHAVKRMIHGHTHRPARHVLDVDGEARERWVLPDWHAGSGGHLRCDPRGCRLILDN